MCNAWKYATFWLDMHVNVCSDEEKDNGAEHEDSWYAKTQNPADTILDINHKSLSDQQDHCKWGIVPVKEAIDSFSSFISGWVKLVNTKWYATGSNSTTTEGQKTQSQYQKTQLGSTGLPALMTY